MKYSLLSLLLIFFSCNSTGQNQENSTEPCNCEIAFKDLVEKLERNYIALAQKRLASKDNAYKERKIIYAKKSTEIKARSCTAFLNDFLSSFEDGHLFVFEHPNYSEVELSGFKQEIKEHRLTKDTLDHIIQSNALAKRTLIDKIVGNWTDGKSDFKVIKDKNEYKAYILNSTLESIEFGECKAIFTPYSNGYEIDYYSYNYSPRYVRGGVYKEGTLFIAENIMWTRKESLYKRELESIDKTNYQSPTLIKLNEKNTILSVPSFLVEAKYFTSFLEKNEHIIKNSENLIIDIRGNRGGNAIYFPLIEMYATQDMEGSQGLILASSDNLAYFERQQKYSSKVFKPVVKRINSHFGEIVDGPLYPGKKFKIRKSKIKNVAILTDEACASAAESFIIHSKKSSTKVKIFGNHTDGMIDYTSVNSLLLKSGKQYIYFGYPTSTLHKDIPNRGYNKTGIIPDIPIQFDVIDKLDFIITYYQD